MHTSTGLSGKIAALEGSRKTKQSFTNHGLWLDLVPHYYRGARPMPSRPLARFRTPL